MIMRIELEGLGDLFWDSTNTNDELIVLNGASWLAVEGSAHHLDPVGTLLREFMQAHKYSLE